MISAVHTRIIADDVAGVLDDVGETLRSLAGSTVLVTGARGIRFALDPAKPLFERGS